MNLENLESIEELRKAKSEINRKIRELKNKPVKYGKVKFDRNENDMYNEWRVSVLKETKRKYGAKRWMSIIVGKDKEQVISQIQPIIDDLTGLLQALKDEE